MASWSNTKNVGSLSGKLRVTVTLVRQEGNGSVVDVTGTLINDNNSGTASGSNVPWNISGAVSKPSANFSFSVAAKRSFTIGTHRATIVHNADGTKTATVSLYVGQTPTTTFGTPGTVSVTFTLPRIPKPPSAPGAPTVSAITASSARVACTAPSNNMGAAINGYRFQRSTVANMSSGVTNVDVPGAAATLSGLAADTDYYTRAYARNSVGYGAVSGIRSFRTLPLAPNAVSGVTRTRVSDSAQDLKWVNNPAAGRPYGNVEIWRRDNVDTAKKRIITLAGTATSYRDSTTVAGRRYDYYFVPTNAGGRGPESGPHGINTTPPAATGVKAVKKQQNINVTWTQNATQYGVMNYEIYDNPGGTGWVLVDTVGDVNTWTHVSPNASVTHQYRVRVSTIIYSAGDTNRLWSVPSTNSVVVQLLAPPLVPTLVGPKGTVDRDEAITFKWVHNPVDTTDQEQAALRYRVNGGAWVNQAITGADEFLTIPALGVSAVVEFQVQTRGEFPTYGPWSALQSFRLSALPTVLINAPVPGPFPESRVTVEWGYWSPDGVAQAAWVAWLVDVDDRVVETRNGTGPATSATFTRTVVDREQYTIWVQVTDIYGLKASDTTSIIADFPIPATTTVNVEFDPQTGACTITFGELPAPGPDEAMPDYLDLERQIGDGPWIALATGLALDGAVTDPVPHLTEVNRYRAVSRTVLPAEAFGEPTEIIPGGSWSYFNTGPGFGESYRIIGNPAVDQSAGRASVVQHMAGLEYPTMVRGSLKTATVGISGTITPDSAQRADFEQLADTRLITCYRDPGGRRIFGNLGEISVAGTLIESISTEITRTHFVEVWNGTENTPEP